VVDQMMQIAGVRILDRQAAGVSDTNTMAPPAADQETTEPLISPVEAAASPRGPSTVKLRTRLGNLRSKR
jgi:hypothetical protein